MEYDRPIVLSIAGLDPCGGAGLLADIKTIEQHQCLGFGVATAITVQTEDRFESLRWLACEEITRQIEPLIKQYTIAAVKIGLIENSRSLDHILSLLAANNIGNIVWDPVLSASSGFDFNNIEHTTDLTAILRKINLITPNMHEATHLAGCKDAGNAAKALSIHTNVLLKGGHHPTHQGTDYLYKKSGKKAFAPTLSINNSKHGSGCILSSSIASYLAKKEDLERSCISAKVYIERILSSTPHLLAYHYV